LGETWAGEIQKDFGYELAIMSREDINTSLMDPSNVSLLKNHLGMEVEVEETLVELVERVRSAANEVAAAWSRLSFIKTSYTRNINDLAPSSIDNVPVRF